LTVVLSSLGVDSRLARTISVNTSKGEKDSSLANEAAAAAALFF